MYWIYIIHVYVNLTGTFVLLNEAFVKLGSLGDRTIGAFICKKYCFFTMLPTVLHILSLCNPLLHNLEIK